LIRRTIPTAPPATAGRAGVQRGKADVKPSDRAGARTLALPADGVVELTVTREP